MRENCEGGEGGGGGYDARGLRASTRASRAQLADLKDLLRRAAVDWRANKYPSELSGGMRNKNEPGWRRALAARPGNLCFWTNRRGLVFHRGLGIQYADQGSEPDHVWLTCFLVTPSCVEQRWQRRLPTGSRFWRTKGAGHPRYHAGDACGVDSSLGCTTNFHGPAARAALRCAEEEPLVLSDGKPRRTTS